MLKPLTACMLAAMLAAPALAKVAPAPYIAPTKAAPQSDACGTLTVPVYFAPGEAVLSPPARQAVTLALQTVGECAIAGMTTTARADDAGDAEAAWQLSQARTTAVLDSLPQDWVTRAPAGVESQIILPASGFASRTLPGERAVILRITLGSGLAS